MPCSKITYECVRWVLSQGAPSLLFIQISHSNMSVLFGVMLCQRIVFVNSCTINEIAIRAKQIIKYPLPHVFPPPAFPLATSAGNPRRPLRVGTLDAIDFVAIAIPSLRSLRRSRRSSPCDSDSVFDLAWGKKQQKLYGDKRFIAQI